MITFTGWDAVLLCLFAGYGFVVCMIATWKRTWGGLQRWAERRVEARLKPDAVLVKKFLRHAKSGRVGLCVGSGFGKHRWLGWICPEERIEFVRCPDCVKGILLPMPMAMISMLVAKNSGHVEILPAREMVAALPSEIEAFKAAMKKCEPEGTEQ